MDDNLYNKRMLTKKGCNMKSKLAVVAVIGSLVAAPAFAWGDREQGALAGIAGLLLWQRLNQPPVVVQQMPPQYPSQAPVYGHYPAPAPLPPVIMPACRQVLSIQYDRFGNEYRYPVTVCGQ